MTQTTLNEFSDWLFNRFVEAEEKSRLSGVQMQNTLQCFVDTVLKPRKYRAERLHANLLLKEMKTYWKDFRNHRLEYVGSESVQKKLEEEEKLRKLYQSIGMDYPFTNKK